MKMIKNKKILAIGAHPDDIEYYSGGTMLKLAKTNQITYVIGTNGGMNGDVDTRKDEQRNASAFVGVDQTVFLNYPDLDLERKMTKVKKDLLEWVLVIKPDIIFSFDPENQHYLHDDFHPDHRIISYLVAEIIMLYSTLPAYINKLHIDKPPLLKKPELWLYDSYRQNHFEDISSHREKKIELLKIFISQNLLVKKIGKIENFNRILFDDKMELI